MVGKKKKAGLDIKLKTVESNGSYLKCHVVKEAAYKKFSQPYSSGKQIII